MFLLFFIVHIFFVLGFFIINSTVLAWIFGILSIAGAVFFSPIRFPKKNKNTSQKTEKSNISSQSSTLFLKKSYVNFFRKNILTVAVIFFYIAVTGILWSASQYFWKDFSYTLLIFLLIILSIYFIFSLLHKKNFWEYENIFLYNLLGVWFVGTVIIIFISSGYKITTLIFLGILISCLVLQAYRQIESKKVNSAKLLFLCALLEIILLLEILISPVGIWQVSLLLITWIVYFEIGSINLFKTFRGIIRSVALILVYFATFFLWYFFVSGAIGFLEWIMLIISSFFNFYVHRRFENYPSLLFTAVTPFILIWVFFLPPSTLGNYILYCIFIGGGWTLLGRIFRTQYVYDEYIFQTITIGALLVSTGYYFFITGFEGVLQISSILLMFSGILFISFLQIRKK